jgi:nucleotide-binding universal stress UspA family protein
MNQPEKAIVVAVGYHGCDAAVEFAVAEAERTGSPLHLVQVTAVPDTVEYAGVYASTMHDVDAAIEQALAHTRKLTADSGTAVTGERVEDRSNVGCLVRHADHGQMIVLQHRRIGALQRIVTGSTTNGVAARAAVPVVSVPEDWSASAAGSVVTVAVQDADEAAELLRAGFEQARSRKTGLVVLHAWWLASGYDVAVVDDTTRRDWDSRARSSLTPALEALKAEFPEVEVAVQVRHAPPTEALLDAAEQSDLLVIGRRHHLLPIGSHLGPHARATLNHSACPVLVVPSAGSSRP